MRVGRTWRFARRNLIEWVANGSEVGQLKATLGKVRVRKRQSVISRLEGGQVEDVHLGTLVKLKRVFRTSWDDLFAEMEVEEG